MSVPSRNPACSTAVATSSSASRFVGRLGAKPPSSPRPVARPLPFSTDLSAWYVSAPHRSASRKLAAPIGAIMNSWMSTPPSACAPPLRMLSIGTGRTRAFGPPTYRNSGRPAESAAARATPSETPRMALAPRLPLLSVPSRSSIAGSTSRCSVASKPTSAGAICSRTASTACPTPLPPYRLLSPSRRSTASKAPVEAPDGTAARAVVPSSSRTSTSTVGLPRESRISRAPMSSMVATGVTLSAQGSLPLPSSVASVEGEVEQRPQVPGRRGTVPEHLVVQRSVARAGACGAQRRDRPADLVVAGVVRGELGGGQQGAAPLARRLAVLLVPALDHQTHRLGLGHAVGVHPHVEDRVDRRAQQHLEPLHAQGVVVLLGAAEPGRGDEFLCVHRPALYERAAPAGRPHARPGLVASGVRELQHVARHALVHAEV